MSENAGENRTVHSRAYGEHAVQEYLPIILLAVAGFLIGGVYATWKAAKLFAVVLGILAVLALAGGVLWLR